jgi:hypothetical protein
VLGFSYLPLKDLLCSSDIVWLYAPGSASTEHFMNTDRLAMIKRGAILLNTARGSLIDTEALLKALDEGRLAGTGLNVLAGEEYLVFYGQPRNVTCAVDDVKPNPFTRAGALAGSVSRRAEHRPNPAAERSQAPRLGRTAELRRGVVRAGRGLEVLVSAFHPDHVPRQYHAG